MGGGGVGEKEKDNGERGNIFKMNNYFLHSVVPYSRKFVVLFL
jgi:hypothetical protein